MLLEPAEEAADQAGGIDAGSFDATGLVEVRHEGIEIGWGDIGIAPATALLQEGQEVAEMSAIAAQRAR